MPSYRGSYELVHYANVILIRAFGRFIEIRRISLITKCLVNVLYCLLFQPNPPRALNRLCERRLLEEIF